MIFLFGFIALFVKMISKDGGLNKKRAAPIGHSSYSFDLKSYNYLLAARLFAENFDSTAPREFIVSLIVAEVIV